MKCAGIILAGGKGTRMNSKTINKVALPFCGKAMIAYGVELFLGFTDPLVIVVGAYAKSVQRALKGTRVLYAEQKRRLGTGHATRVGVATLKKYTPDVVLVGYGDHLMFYKKSTLQKFLTAHKKQKNAVTLMTATYTKPNELAWGRILRNKKGDVIGIVEQKDATPAQRKISELNVGLYCFDWKFLHTFISKLKRSSVSKEYYLTDMAALAIENGFAVNGFKVDFSEVGLGVNKQEELEQSQKLFSHKKRRHV